MELPTATVTNVRRQVEPFLFAGVPSLSTSFVFRDRPPVEAAGIADACTFAVSESGEGADLNGDGDVDDAVVHATRLEDRDRDGRLDFADDCVGRSSSRGGSGCAATAP